MNNFSDHVLENMKPAWNTLKHMTQTPPKSSCISQHSKFAPMFPDFKLIPIPFIQFFSTSTQTSMTNFVDLRSINHSQLRFTQSGLPHLQLEQLGSSFSRHKSWPSPYPKSCSHVLAGFRLDLDQADTQKLGLLVNRRHVNVVNHFVLYIHFMRFYTLWVMGISSSENGGDPPFSSSISNDGIFPNRNQRCLEIPPIFWPMSWSLIEKFPVEKFRIVKDDGARLRDSFEVQLSRKFSGTYIIDIHRYS